ncbi:hypothetical protein ACHAWF_014763 [Thalassiosira exigua]
MGYVIFMRNVKGAKRKMFNWYGKTVLVPGINDHRLLFSGYDVEDHDDIDVRETAISYCDGDIPQLDAIKESLYLMAENRIICNKQCCAASAVDLAIAAANKMVWGAKLDVHWLGSSSIGRRVLLRTR